MKVYGASINRKDTLDTTILSILLCQVFFFRWLGMQNMINNILLVLICLSFLIDFRDFVKSWMLFGILLLIVYPLINYIVIGGSIDYLYDNFMRTIKGILILLYFCYLLYKKTDLVRSFFESKLVVIVFNLYMVINIPILLLQLSGHYYLSGLNYATAVSTFDWDYISGLFGLYGTPTLALFSTFLFFYNYYHIRRMHRRTLPRFIFWIYNFLILIFNIWISTQNDNKGFYIIFIMYLLGVFIFAILSNVRENGSSRKKRASVFFKFLLIVLIICAACYVAYRTIDSVQSTINSLQAAVLQGLNYSTAIGSGERLGMILFLFSNPSKWAFGYGLGQYVYNSADLGFAHFGQADLGTYLCLGGFVQIGVWFFALFSIIWRSFKYPAEKVILLLIYLVLAIYTQIFANSSSTICSAFLLIILYLFSYNRNYQVGEKFETEYIAEVNE